MKKHIATLLLCFIPFATAQAQKADPDVSIRVNGDFYQAADEENGVVVLVHGKAHIEGSVDELVIVDGTAELQDAIIGNLTVAQGSANLQGATRVDGDVRLFNATIDQSAEAIIAGEVMEGDEAQWGPGAAFFGVMFGVGFMLAVLLSGVLLAILVPHSVRRTGMAITDEPLNTVVAGLVLWIAMPLIAVTAMFTIVGMPTGLGILLLLLPLLGFVGYLISGIRIGDLIMEKQRGTVEFERPIQATILGLSILLILGWIPVIGFLITPIAAFVGAGALGLAIWRVITRKETWRTEVAVAEG